jgi:hypothetical protein
MADRPLFLTNFGAIDVGGDPPREFYPLESPPLNAFRLLESPSF